MRAAEESNEPGPRNDPSRVPAIFLKTIGKLIGKWGSKQNVALMQHLCYMADRNLAPQPHKKMLLSLMIDSNHKMGLGNKNNDKFRREILSFKIFLYYCGLWVAQLV